MEHNQNPSNITESEMSKLFKIRKTVLKMLEDRGYVVSSNDKSKSFDDWRATFKSKRDSLFFCCQKITDKDDLIYVEYTDKDKLGVGDITNFAETLRNLNVKSGIMIIKNAISALAKQKVKEYEEIMHIEYFEEKELIINITEHELVPKHYPLSEEEKKHLLAKYRLKESQLPKILVTDPVAKYLGLKKGMVVKIVRPSETAGRYITYRIAQ